jgi:hypothetical protein
MMYFHYAQYSRHYLYEEDLSMNKIVRDDVFKF